MKEQQENINRLSDDFNKILCFEDKFKRFSALGDLARETASSDIPNFLKERLIYRIGEEQGFIVGFLNFGNE